LGGILLLVGLGIAAVAVGQERASARCSGSRSPRSGWRCLRPLSGGSTADTALPVRPNPHRRPPDHPSTERTEAPCVVCGEAFERGVVRRRRDETVVAGVPIRTPLAAVQPLLPAAPAELFGGDADETAIDPDVSLDDSEFDDSEFDDSEFGRDEETERERERER